jgi:hypothetical protein
LIISQTVKKELATNTIFDPPWFLLDYTLQCTLVFLLPEKYFKKSYTPGDKKHKPSKLNYYTFDDELTPLGVNSLSSPQQMDVVYKK